MPINHPMTPIQRGLDSSGRPLVLTRQHWQVIDRLNAGPARGLLVPIQGGFRRGHAADASGDTHDLAKCSDIRRWNLSNEIAAAVKRAARDPKQIGGNSWWERTAAQGFDPHFHNLCVGDRPGSPGANAQEDAYLDGFNGLGSGYRGYRDDFWRPSKITAYKYIQEDDMFEKADREKMDEILTAVRKGNTSSFKREQAIKIQLRALATRMGQRVDKLTLRINETEDEKLKQVLRDQKAEAMEDLKNLDWVDQEDNPSDDAMDEINTK